MASEGPRTFTIRSSDIERCPIRSLLPEHWRPDGTCKCAYVVVGGSLALGVTHVWGPFPNVVAACTWAEQFPWDDGADWFSMLLEPPLDRNDQPWKPEVGDVPGPYTTEGGYRDERLRTVD